MHFTLGDFRAWTLDELIEILGEPEPRGSGRRWPCGGEPPLDHCSAMDLSTAKGVTLPPGVSPPRSWVLTFSCAMHERLRDEPDTEDAR